MDTREAERLVETHGSISLTSRETSPIDLNRCAIYAASIRTASFARPLRCQWTTRAPKRANFFENIQPADT